MSSTKTKAVAKQANALPELVVSTPDFVSLAMSALTARSSHAQYEQEEAVAKDGLADLASSLRETEATNDNYIGIIRIVKPAEATEDLAPVRVDFKMSAKNSALAMSEMETIDELFGALRPQLWEKGKAVTDIHDPSALVQALQDAGQNPWDYLKLSVKDGMDAIVSRHPGVTAVEAILPKTGFLARLQEFGKNLGTEAKNYVRSYLQSALSPAVNLGSKGKA
jgi:hypothetical protein